MPMQTIGPLTQTPDQTPGASRLPLNWYGCMKLVSDIGFPGKHILHLIEKVASPEKEISVPSFTHRLKASCSSHGLHIPWKRFLLSQKITNEAGGCSFYIKRVEYASRLSSIFSACIHHAHHYHAHQ